VSDAASWQNANTEYLSGAVAWLRARLEAYAAEEPATTALTPPPPREEPRSIWQQLATAPRTEAASAPSPEVTPPSAWERPARAGATLASVPSTMDPPPALLILGHRLGLSPFEHAIFLLCAAMELDTGIAALCARAHRDPGRAYPTFALALTLFDDPAWDALSPERPLRYWRLIEVSPSAVQALTASPLRADERIVNYVKGLNHLDDRLAPLLTPVDPGSVPADLPPSHRAAANHLVEQLKQVPAGQKLPVLQLLGGDTPTKQLVAGSVAAAFGLRAYRLPADLLPVQAAELEALARLWQRESLLLAVALYLDVRPCEGEGASAAQAAAVNRFLTRVSGVTLVDARDAWMGSGEPAVLVDIAKPTAAEQRAAWAAALGERAGDSPGLLAGQFSLNLPSLQQVARTVLSEADGGERSLHHRLWAACLASTRPRLSAMAQRLEPKANWHDLVLPAAEVSLLREIAAQVGQRTRVYDDWGFRDKMTRGLGISALFAGESGTGKTMAAEVLANDLRLSLYRIDLSAVVSKYIGETEKNLRQLFEGGEDGGAILFFDEADALFGKRSEVKDSHDRYANIEINYLLQRMEAYRGLAILATNMKSALDPAFLRRLRFIVTFPFPGVAERKAIWLKAFPERTRTLGLDHDRLARLNLTGGHIHNIALNAAFLAAKDDRPITMPLVLAGARAEFRKLDRPINEADFRWQGAAGAPA
jgi:ATPase family protein associated with various cellular activities (AAA)/winged helix domain-containing protein